MSYKNPEKSREYYMAYRLAHPEKSREYHRARYMEHRDEILAKLAAAKIDKAESVDVRKPFALSPYARATEGNVVTADPIDSIIDTRTRIERARSESMESVRLRLLWAVSAGGDEGTVARTAIAVIRFAESEGVLWTDRALRGLHLRLSLAEGLSSRRFYEARETIAKELFIPL